MSVQAAGRYLNVNVSYSLVTYLIRFLLVIPTVFQQREPPINLPLLSIILVNGVELIYLQLCQCLKLSKSPMKKTAPFNLAIFGDILLRELQIHQL